MKNIKSFHEFLNEKQSLNESRFKEPKSDDEAIKGLRWVVHELAGNETVEESKNRNGMHVFMFIGESVYLIGKKLENVAKNLQGAIIMPSSVRFGDLKMIMGQRGNKVEFTIEKAFNKKTMGTVNKITGEFNLAKGHGKLDTMDKKIYINYREDEWKNRSEFIKDMQLLVNLKHKEMIKEINDLLFFPGWKIRFKGKFDETVEFSDDFNGRAQIIFRITRI